MGRYLELLKHPGSEIEIVPEVRSTPPSDTPRKGAHTEARSDAPPTTLTTETTKAPHLPFAPAAATPAALEDDDPPVRLAVADPEVAWRLDAMRRQVPSTGSIPFLVARTIQTALGTCLSCGDPLGFGQPYRCRPCVDAAILALRDCRPSAPEAGRR